MPTTADITYDLSFISEEGSAYGAAGVFGWELTVTAVGGDLPDINVFCYAQAATDIGVFSNVCNIHDMEAYNVSSPAEGDAFFRAATVKLLFKTQDDADEALQTLRNDLQLLSDQYAYAGQPVGTIEDSTTSTVGAIALAGELAGDGTNSVSVVYPTPQTGNLYISSTLPLTVVSDSNGFSLSSPAPITQFDLIRWAVLP